jgi:(1->4)-alpha-D-glucan 1-alpha-D-glucosylmutase
LVAPEQICTYRLQLNPAFGFDSAAGIADYLARLGVSHVYLSPITQATPGSAHGYDVCDPTVLSADLGGPEAYERLCIGLEAAGIGQIVDIVPNHMAFAVPGNRWLDDVLRNGPGSRYASYFDLRWSEDTNGTPFIELPFLGEKPEALVASGDLRLAPAPDGVRLVYGDLALPLRPGTEPATTETAPEELLDLLRRQHHRLVSWRTAEERLSYRRFFDITTLIGFRAEDEAAFEDSHRLLFQLLQRGCVDGLRIDHIDGLREPEGYLRRLRDQAPDARIVVEKILAVDEPLRGTWPVDGTTGYDFLNAVNGLFVDPEGEAALTSLHAEFTGVEDTYETVLAEAKRTVLQRLFSAELSDLANALSGLAGNRWTRDDCAAVLRETLVAFPVYRTYVRPGAEPTPDDTELVEKAVRRAAESLPNRLGPLLDTLRDILLLRTNDDAELALRFQQLSGPVMAKGAEDTAFYRFNRLISLNEVGGEPSRFGVSLPEFHAFCAGVARSRPNMMLATATHDTKRGEDARLRIDCLSQIPGEWSAAVQRWAKLNEPLRAGGLSDRITEYLFYQTLAGAWPLTPERASPYMLKAAREAKQHTSWRQPDEGYEAALRRFVEGSLSNPAFTSEVAAFVERLEPLAVSATLAQTLLKLTAPGVPDIYQGCELTDLSLVDPDNRRPVDYAVRRKMLDTADACPTLSDAIEGGGADLAKLWLTRRVLETRREHAGAFRGDYVSLYAEGDDSVVAFVRGRSVVTVAKTRGMPGAGTLTLPSGEWRNVLTGQTPVSGPVALGGLLAAGNVALLVREDAP